MNSTLKRAVGFSVVALTSAATIGLTGLAAHAATGNLTMSPASGFNTTAASVDTPQACDPSATHIQGRMVGAGFGDSSASPATQGAGWNVTANAALTSLPNNAAGGKTVPLALTFQGFADQQSPPAPLSGIHTITLRCKGLSATSTITDTFSMQINFTGAPGSQTYTTVAPAAPATTTTITGASPASPQIAGTSVTFSGTVAPTSGGGSPAGNVQLQDNGANIGPSVAVAANAFSITVPAPAAGSHSFTAVFTSSNTATFASSTSAGFAYTTTAAPATATSTTLTANPNPALDTQTVTLTATVAPSAAGSVSFLDGATSVATATVSGGVATASKVFAAGTHSLTAQFNSASPSTFANSTSAPVSLVVTADNSGHTDIQTITGEIPAGTITLTTPYTAASPLDLGVLVLNSSNGMYSANKPFQNIKVIDTRAGNLGWTVSAKADPLNSGANSINGQNVGLTALAATYTAGNALQSGVAVTNNPAANPAVAPGAAGTQGLGGTAHTVASAPAGTSTGEVTVNGTLTLNAPTSTPAGIYTGIITFTIA